MKINQRQREEYIKQYQFHPAILEKLKAKHPLLSETQLNLVISGLRDFFYLCAQTKAIGKMVSMPSRIVDDAWHEFILFSREYSDFCECALDHYLHHTPAEAMPTPTSATDGIKLAWRLACDKEQINPTVPNRLPLLFAMDSLLNIDDGFIYKLDCKSLTSGNNEFCATDIGCGGGCGG